MKKYFFFGLVLFLFLVFDCSARRSVLQDRRKRNLFQRSVCPIRGERIVTKPNALLNASKYALQYFNASREVDRALVRSKVLEKDFLNRKNAEDTLRFIVRTIEEDKRKRLKKSRISDTNFLKKHFSFIRWNGDSVEAKKNNVTIPKWYDGGKLKNGKIKLTSYALFKTRGSYYKTKKYRYALYEMSSQKFVDSYRFRYSKQSVLKGVLEKKEFNGHVKPLVWVSREGLEEALMQGSIIVVMPNGKKRLFNAHKSNGIPFVKKIADRRKQKKYWFFKELTKKGEPGAKDFFAFLRFGGIAFAGDTQHLGFGKIIALRYKNLRTKTEEMRIGILVDRGSAFSNNLYQLDLFSGIFNKKEMFKKFIGQFPPSVDAYILKWKG